MIERSGSGALRGFLDRFRRQAAVTAQAADDLAAELRPLFAALDAIDREAEGLRAAAVHLDVAAQVYALAAEARRAADLADPVGADALTPLDRAYLRFGGLLDAELIAQGDAVTRTLDRTLDLAWHAVSTLPRSALSLPDALLDRHYEADAAATATG